MRHSRISKKSSSNPWIESVNVALRSTHIRQIKMWFIHVDCPFKQSCDRYLFIFVTITTKVTWLWIGSPQKLMGKIGVAQIWLSRVCVCVCIVGQQLSSVYCFPTMTLKNLVYMLMEPPATREPLRCLRYLQLEIYFPLSLLICEKTRSRVVTAWPPWFRSGPTACLSTGTWMDLCEGCSPPLICPCAVLRLAPGFPIKGLISEAVGEMRQCFSVIAEVMRLEVTYINAWLFCFVL